MLAKDPVRVIEVAIDLDRNLTDFWKTLQDEATFARFAHRVEAIPFAQTEWEEATAALA